MASADDSVPTAQKASWGTFLKQIASFSGDLSSMTAPPFILSPVSLAEFPSYWGEPTVIFEDIAGGKNPEERMLLVTKWFLATLAGQFTRREKETGSEKKPLNPVLGEQFLGTYSEGTGNTALTAEQVSHHPPITAYELHNTKLGIAYTGHCAQKTSFSGRAITVRQVGHGILSIASPTGGNSKPENYLITLPQLQIEGILLGKPYVELTEHSYIQSSAGWSTKISYAGRGWISGKAHSFTAHLTPPGAHHPAYTIEGTWTDASRFAKGSKREGDLFLDAAVPRKPIVVRPVEGQGEWESRRVWRDVAERIKKGDFDGASTHKTALENAQRQRRKAEKDAGETWRLQLFNRLERDPVYEELARACKHKPEQEEAFHLKA